MKTSSELTPPGRTKLARSFRKRPTKAEAWLWGWLRGRGLGVKFRRQVPVGPYIVDFLSLEVKLIVEVDGGQHGEELAQVRDRERDHFLRNEGYEVMRFWSRDILGNMEGCLQQLGEKIEVQQKKLAEHLPSQAGKRPG